MVIMADFKRLLTFGDMLIVDNVISHADEVAAFCQPLNRTTTIVLYSINWGRIVLWRFDSSDQFSHLRF